MSTAVKKIIESSRQEVLERAHNVRVREILEFYFEGLEPTKSDLEVLKWTADELEKRSGEKWLRFAFDSLVPSLYNYKEME